MPDGTPIEGRGVVPMVEANFPASAFGAKDPVFEKGVEVLETFPKEVWINKPKAPASLNSTTATKEIPLKMKKQGAVP